MCFFWSCCNTYCMFTTPICFTLIRFPFFHTIPITAIADSFHIKTLVNAVNCFRKVVFFHIFFIFFALIWISVICIGISLATVFSGCSGTCMPFSKIIILISVFCKCIKIHFMYIFRICIIMILSMGVCIQPCQHCTSGWPTKRRSTIRICKFRPFRCQFFKIRSFRTIFLIPIPMIICLMIILNEYYIWSSFHFPNLLLLFRF